MTKKHSRAVAIVRWGIGRKFTAKNTTRIPCDPLKTADEKNVECNN